MKTRIKRSKAMSITNCLVHKGWEFGAAQTQAWKVVRAMEQMEQGQAMIRFYREDEIIPQQRVAAFISGNFQPTNKINKKRSPLQVLYNDLNKRGIRSFRVERFISSVAA